MAGFGFIKGAAQKAGKKMYGYGQQASRGAGQFIEKHPVMAAGGILGGTYAVGQTDMWQSPNNVESDAIDQWFKKPWDENSEKEAVDVYNHYVSWFQKNSPNTSPATMKAFSERVQSVITSKPNTPEKFKRDFFNVISDEQKSKITSDYHKIMRS